MRAAITAKVLACLKLKDGEKRHLERMSYFFLESKTNRHDTISPVIIRKNHDCVDQCHITEPRG